MTYNKSTEPFHQKLTKLSNCEQINQHDFAQFKKRNKISKSLEAQTLARNMSTPQHGSSKQGFLRNSDMGATGYSNKKNIIIYNKNVKMILLN